MFEPENTLLAKANKPAAVLPAREMELSEEGGNSKIGCGGVAAANFHGGNYARPHMEFYRDTPLTLPDMRAPEFGDVDIVERVIPVAKKHGIRVFCFLFEDNSLPAAVKANWEPLYEVDHHGRRTNGHPGGPCFNNPGYQNFTLGLVEDYARSYDIGGMMWGSERRGGGVRDPACRGLRGRSTCANLAGGGH
jgi:hypothetical protein